MLNRLSQHHIDTITLWYLVQHSLSSFYKIAQHFENLADALQPKHIQLWQSLGIHKNHIERLKQLHSTESQKHLQQLLQHIQQDCDFIVTPTDQYYPPNYNLLATNHPFYLVREIYKHYYNPKLPSSAVEKPVHTDAKSPMILHIT